MMQMAGLLNNIFHIQRQQKSYIFQNLYLRKTIETQYMALSDLIDLELLSKVNLLQHKIRYSAMEAMSESLYCHDCVCTNLGQGH